MENLPQLEPGDRLLWVVAYGAEGQGWYYPNFPQGQISANGVLEVELPLEIDEADLQNFTSFCGSSVRVSDPAAAGVLIHLLVLPSKGNIAQTSSSKILSRPSNGDILAFRTFSDRDVRIVGRCPGGLMTSILIDVDLKMGWNFVTAQIRGLPFTPTIDFRQGIPPGNVSWNVIEY